MLVHSIVIFFRIGRCPKIIRPLFGRIHIRNGRRYPNGWRIDDMQLFKKFRGTDTSGGRRTKQDGKILVIWTGFFFRYYSVCLQLENASSSVLKPLEEFRKKYIGGVKNEKKKFEKQTAKFCQNQERYLNKTTKNPNSLQEVREIKFAPAPTIMSQRFRR